MPRRAKHCSPQGRWRTNLQGLLLIEAALSAVVIAVGLVLITRALSTPLNVLQSVQEYAALQQVAQKLLVELERGLESGILPDRARTGLCEAPDAGYQWVLSAQPLDETETAVPVSAVTLSVSRAQERSRIVSVRSVWPTALVPAEWM